MIVRYLSKAAATNAWGTIALRGSIVAVNFAVMIGLAAFLGLQAFGALAVVWGLAMIAGTALSGGAPLLLLQQLTDGQGMSTRGLFFQLFALPAGLAILAFGLLQTVFPAGDVLAVLAGGLAINLATCLASIMRALGSVWASMVLRDAMPQVALGLAGVTTLGAPAATVLIHAVLGLGLICAFTVPWCIRHRRWGEMTSINGRAGGVAWSLWATSLSGMVLAQIDVVVGGSILSAEQIGLYAVLKRVANLVALPVSVATWVSAKPVSSAFGGGDTYRLQTESARGSQIAFIPGFVLLVAALAAIPFLDNLIAQNVESDGRFAFLAFALGAFLQIFFASSFTVATLCGQAMGAAMSRVVSIAIYLFIIFTVGSGMSIFAHACAYVAANTIGILLLWRHLRNRLGIDTSAAVAWRKTGALWKPS
ncbi:MAG: hypothetical protein AAFP85_01055 [Pseudomonadota bacterium]